MCIVNTEWIGIETFYTGRVAAVIRYDVWRASQRTLAYQCPLDSTFCVFLFCDNDPPLRDKFIGSECILLTMKKMLLVGRSLSYLYTFTLTSPYEKLQKAQYLKISRTQAFSKAMISQPVFRMMNGFRKR